MPAIREIFLAASGWSFWPGAVAAEFLMFMMTSLSLNVADC